MQKDLDTTTKPIETAQTVPAEVSTGPAPQVAAPAPGGATTHAPRQTDVQRPPRKIAVEEEEEEATFFQRYRAGIIVAAIVLIGGCWIAFRKPSAKGPPAKKAPEPMMIRIQPLPPPPPPPPPPKNPPPPPKDEKVPEQAPMAAPDKKPEAAKPKPVDKPPEGLGTNIKGPGQGMAGLGSGSGNGMIGGTGNGPGGGSAASWYAGQVQTKVAEALRNHRRTRNASLQGIKFSISLDGTGRVTATKLLVSTGDSALDGAIQNEVLNGIRLQEPPPGGKPMTVTMVFNARRPK